MRHMTTKLDKVTVLMTAESRPFTSGPRIFRAKKKRERDCLPHY